MIMPSPDLSSEELNWGNCLSAVTHALIMKASIVSLKPRFSVSAVCALRKASRSVMSASSNCVTCGIEIQLRCRYGPESFWMRGSGLVSTAPNLAKSTSGQAGRLNGNPAPALPSTDLELPESAPFTNACTSVCRILPFGPLARTRVSSTPSSRANLRTDGLACGLVPGSSCVSTAGVAAGGLAATAGEEVEEADGEEAEGGATDR